MNNIAYREDEPWLAHDPRVYLVHMARARELQSETFGRAFGAMGRLLARTASRAYRSVADGVRRRRTIAELSRLDDHMLADIGIDRERIPAIARGLLAPKGDAPTRLIPTAPCPPELRGEAANDSKSPPLAA